MFLELTIIFTIEMIMDLRINFLKLLFIIFNIIDLDMDTASIFQINVIWTQIAINVVIIHITLILVKLWNPRAKLNLKLKKLKYLKLFEIIK